jgi:hypothetical protein
MIVYIVQMIVYIVQMLVYIVMYIDFDVTLRPDNCKVAVC